MTTQRILPHGSAFTTLHGVLTHGSDPSLGEVGNPVKHIQTVTTQALSPQGGRSFIALVGGAKAAQSASFVVDDNDFSTGVATLVIGNYQIVSNIDYLPGATTDLTATSLAASLDRLPGYSVSSAGSTVTVLREPALEKVEFRILHLGTVMNFITLIPSNGFMDPGGPHVSPPILT